MVRDLELLQAARLKGRLSPELASSSCAVDPQTAAAALTQLREAGLVKGEPSVRLTPEGRARLAELVAAERAELDTTALAGLYHDFDEHNTSLKEIVNAWQMRCGQPNDHTDNEYDQRVLNRLVRLDEGFQPLARRIVGQAPRLSPYPGRFSHAILQVRRGDTSYVARPITDSYHTVWFEFHEELIGLLGLRREDEAAAGRAV